MTDSAGKVHIVYYDHSSQSIKYATNKSGDWTVSMIVQSTTIGAPTYERTTVLRPSLAIDQNDNLHVAYTFQKNQTVSPWATIENSLRYATTKGALPGSQPCMPGSAWNCSTAVDTGGSFSSIAIDTENKVRIAHYDSVSPGTTIPYTLKQVKLEELGAWSITNIHTINWSLQLYKISMDIDSNNKSHISFTIMNHFAGLDEARVYYVRGK